MGYLANMTASYSEAGQGFPAEAGPSRRSLAVVATLAEPLLHLAPGIVTMTQAGQPSVLQRATLGLALGLTIVLLALGASWYGWSLEVHHRFWSDIFGRASGPMTFRFFLQPTMSLIAAIPDGIRDAREGHSSFFWTSRQDETLHRGRLRQGLYATGRILLLGLSMDLVYQFKVFDHFFPVEAVLFALSLAVLPYFIWRWMVERVARRWRARKSSGGAR